MSGIERGADVSFNSTDLGRLGAYSRALPVGQEGS